MILEKKIEQAVCKYAVKLGFVQFKISSQTGLPDRCFLYGGRCFFIEFKRTKLGRLSEGQIFIHNLWKKKRIKIYVIDTTKDGKALLDQFYKLWKMT